MAKVQELAAQAKAYLINQTLLHEAAKGEDFSLGDYFVRHDAPAWVSGLFTFAKGQYDDNWRLHMIFKSLEHLADSPDSEHSITIYKETWSVSDFLAWLASNIERMKYVDATFRTHGYNGYLLNNVVMGQAIEKKITHNKVIESLRKKAGNGSDKLGNLSIIKTGNRGLYIPKS